MVLFTLLFADRLIVKNIKKFASATERFTSQIHGGSPERVPASIGSNDEIGELADKFELMQESMIGYIESLAEKTSREEKISRKTPGCIPRSRGERNDLRTQKLCRLLMI